MIARLKHITLTFLAVFAAYWLYVLIAVPFIEPPVKRRVAAASSEIDPPNQQARRQHLAQLTALFSPGSWELDDPKIVETDQGLFLFREYKPLPDGKMDMKPCTIVFYSSNNKRSRGDFSGRPIVMSAPSGATLHFDSSADTMKGEFGKLRGGRVHGEIRIYGPETSPGSGDELEILTRDIVIDEQKITTLHDVDFRFGQSFGSGRDMIITLAPPQVSGKAKQSMGPAIGGAKKLELVRDVKFHLHTQPKVRPAQVAIPSDGQSPDAGTTPDPKSSEQRASHALFGGGGETTLEVTCRGSFIYDFDESSASFADQVDVVRLATEGPSDQLNCRLLTIYLSNREQALRVGEATENGSDAAAQNPGPGSSIERIVAEGEPAILRAPSVNAAARADYMEYNLVTRRVQIGFKSSNNLETRRPPSKQPAFVQQGPNQMEAPWIMYESPEESGRMGRVWADGPGQMRGTFGKDQTQPLEATWGDKLFVRPYEGNQVITMTGGSTIRYAENQRFGSKELHLWLYEVPDQSRPPSITESTSQKFVLVPDRLLAQEEVQVDSPRFSGRLQRVEAWFDYTQRDDLSNGARASNESFSNNPRQGTTTNNGAPGQPESPPQKFDIAGQIARLQLRKLGNETVLEAASVEGGVEIVDAASLAARISPQLKITGDTLNIVDASNNRARIRVNGTPEKPAFVVARGMTMTGAAIQLSQTDNRIWIDGAGRMTLPPPPPQPKPRGQFLYQNERAIVASSPLDPMTVDWQRGMVFDGLTAHFEQNVETNGKQWNAQGELVEMHALGNTLDVRLNQLVNFAQPPSQGDIGMSRITYGGSVMLTTRTFKERAQIAFDQMQLNNLVLDQEPNASQPSRFHGDGPGWVSSVRFGNDSPTPITKPVTSLTSQPNNRTAPNQQLPRSRLTYLYVEFARGLEGNLTEKKAMFLEQVKAVHGPVNTWEEQLRPDPRFLGVDGVFLTCARLSIAEGPSYIPGQQSMELDATGNATVEGRTFAARGGRISYAQAKDMMTLEGDVRSEAELWQLPRTNQVKPDAIARKIMYWKTDNRVEVDGARYVDISRFSNPQPGR